MHFLGTGPHSRRRRTDAIVRVPDNVPRGFRGTSMNPTNPRGYGTRWSCDVGAALVRDDEPTRVRNAVACDVDATPVREDMPT